MIKLFAATEKKRGEEKRLPCLDSIIKPEIIYENKSGLSKVYNQILDNNHDDDIIFIHDDVIVNDCLLEQKIEDAKKRGYDIVGVAGAKGYNPLTLPYKKTPLGWWSQAGSRFGLAGQMMHRFDESDWMFMTTYGPSPSRTVVIDGCFMAILSENAKTVRFNENYDFHFYDVSFCMNAIKHGCKIGVEPILCTHLSHGPGVMSHQFMEAQQKFIGEYFRVNI